MRVVKKLEMPPARRPSGQGPVVRAWVPWAAGPICAPWGVVLGPVCVPWVDVQDPACVPWVVAPACVPWVVAPLKEQVVPKMLTVKRASCVLVAAIGRNVVPHHAA